MDHAIAESVLVQQLKLQPDIVRQSWIASSHHDGGEEQMTRCTSWSGALQSKLPSVSGTYPSTELIAA